MGISGSSKINFGQQYVIQKLNQIKVVEKINYLLGKLQKPTNKIVLVVQGDCNAGKSTFIKKIIGGEIKLGVPPSQIAHIEGNYFETLLKNLNISYSLRSPYNWIQDDIKRYSDINGAFAEFERTALFFEINQAKLFFGNPFSMVLYERGDAYPYLQLFRTISDKFYLKSKIKFPNMIGVFVTVVREPSDARHFDIYVQNI